MFINSLKLLVRFSSSTVSDLVSGSVFSAVGEDVNIDILSDGDGYIMKNDQYLFSDGISASVSDSFTFGFWLYPHCHGFVENPSSGEPSDITMPLFDFLSGSNSVIKMFETTDEDCLNFLTLYLGNDFYIETSKYSTSIWHYFYICYDGSEIKVYIDGVEDSLSSYGSIPSSIDGYSLDFYINNNLSGYSYNAAKNLGYVDDIFLLNDFVDDISNIKKIINNGILYSVDDEYNSINVDCFGLFMNDPETITVTSSVDDVSYIYIGRNDGKILRGSPLFWENRRIFSNNDENNIFSLNGDDSISDGFLKIKESIIRL